LEPTALASILSAFAALTVAIGGFIRSGKANVQATQATNRTSALAELDAIVKAQGNRITELRRDVEQCELSKAAILKEHNNDREQHKRDREKLMDRVDTLQRRIWKLEQNG
jgi:hypothetical protein